MIFQCLSGRKPAFAFEAMVIGKWDRCKKSISRTEERSTMGMFQCSSLAKQFTNVLSFDAVSKKTMHTDGTTLNSCEMPGIIYYLFFVSNVKPKSIILEILLFSSHANEAIQSYRE